MKLRERIIELGPHTKGDTTDDRQVSAEGLLDAGVIKSIEIHWKLGSLVENTAATHAVVGDELILSFSLASWSQPVGMWIGEVEFTWLDDNTTTWWTSLKLPVRGEVA
jgi:hypothetical protein